VTASHAVVQEAASLATLTSSLRVAMNDSVLTARWVTLVSAVMSANRDFMERPTMLLYVSLLAIFIRVHPLPKMDKLDQLCDTHKIRFKVFRLARLPHVLLHRKKRIVMLFFSGQHGHTHIV